MTVSVGRHALLVYELGIRRRRAGAGVAAAQRMVWPLAVGSCVDCYLHLHHHHHHHLRLRHLHHHLDYWCGPTGD